MAVAELTADTAEFRTLPRLARAASQPRAKASAMSTDRSSQRFERTRSNLSPAAPLEAAEEEKQRMGPGALAATATSVTALTTGTTTTGSVTEAALIARAQAGDHAAFEVIFTQYQTQIYNYVYRTMGSAEDAFDMTQDTFLKAYLALPKTSDDLRVGAWLYRIATNVCLDELRHRKLVKWQPWEAFLSVFHPTQVAKDSPERDTIDRENTEEVQLILDKLHPKYRMCLILREYHDLSYDEIADVLNTTRAAVKSLLFRAREEFRQVYAKVERKPGQHLVQSAK
jgi:RNA polymerase sigma-70 factor (ECF subfamily)